MLTIVRAVYDTGLVSMGQLQETIHLRVLWSRDQ